MTAENLVLFRRVDRLPDSERRRILDRGDSRGTPYVVTDRLAGYADFKEWVTTNAVATPNPTFDEQFLQLFEAAPEAPLTLTPEGARELKKSEAAPPEAASRKRRRILPVAAKSLAGLVLGVLMALLVLAIVVAYFAFRPI
jgi:hypothetical protein